MKTNGIPNIVNSIDGLVKMSMEIFEHETPKTKEIGWNFNEDIHFAKVVNIGGEQAIKIGFDIIRLKNPEYVEPLVNAMRNASRVDLQSEGCSCTY